MSSKYFNSRHLHAIDRIGDLMIPGDQRLPQFSSTKCVSQIDRILEHMPESDRSDLKMLLAILSFFPRFLLRLFFQFLERAPIFPGPAGSLLRLIRLGLRGVVMTLYYGDTQVLQVLEYQVSVYTDDLASH